MQTYSYIYSLPYIGVFFLFLVLAYLEEKTKESHKSIIGNISLIIYFIFIGFRGYVGWDWHSYYEIFNSFQPLGEVKTIIYKESITEILSPGFEFIMRFFKLFSDDYLVFISFISLLSSFVFRHLFKKYDVNVSLGFALVIAFGLNIQIDLLRNSISILLFLYSIEYIYQKKPIYFLFLNLIGASIHLSSLLFIPLYFIINKKFNLTIIKILLIVGVIFYFLQLDVATSLIEITSYFSPEIESKFIVYKSIESYFKGEINYSLLFLKLFFALVLIYYYNIISKKNKYLIPFLNLSILNIYSFLFFSSFAVIQSRLQILFILAFVIVIPNILKKTNYKLLAYSGFIIFQTFSILVRYDVILFNYQNTLFISPNIDKNKMIFDNNAYIINPLK
jgi:hypothetical protein